MRFLNDRVISVGLSATTVIVETVLTSGHGYSIFDSSLYRNREAKWLLP